jgi:hypothetical protein
MQRAQSVRHYTRASTTTAATGSDDLGVLKEVSEESTEVTLRRQLLEKEKQNDKVREILCFSPQAHLNSGSLPPPRSQLRDQIQALQTQLTHRPPIEAIQALRKEYSNLELILQGTQRENERAMTELERSISLGTRPTAGTCADDSCIGANRERSF